VKLPRAFGPYQLVEKLGQGGMAEVFKAQSFGASGFEKTVVVKTLLPERQGDGVYEKMFIEEARLHARLSHQNLVQVQELGVSDGCYFVRLDFVDGGDLATLMNGAPVPRPLALWIADQLLLALDFVHRATDDSGRPLGLVHRDVSPGNVLLSVEGEVKLSDFGIAKATHLEEQTRPGVRKGKYAYMSPEQVSGRPLTAASDQFALGVTLVELLTGSRPFDRATPLETMDGVREALRPPLESLPEPLREVLWRALAKEPLQRFVSAEHFRKALGAMPSTPELATWVRAARASRRESPLP
jgi:serine/threonine-protein kinase